MAICYFEWRFELEVPESDFASGQQKNSSSKPYKELDLILAHLGEKLVD